MENKINYFKQKEFTCKCGCGKNYTKFDFVKKLDEARAISGAPYCITSGFRCTQHNKNVGGIHNSSHLKGLAVDIKIFNNEHLYHVLRGLFMAGFKRILYYRYSSFIHVDDDLNKINPLFKIVDK